MLTAGTTDSLYTRIIHRYFGFGLAGISILVCLSVLSTPAQRSTWLLPTACVTPLIILWLGRFELRRVLAAPEQILSQLSKLPHHSAAASDKLIPVPEAEPSAAGWNQLLQQLYTGGMSDALEQKLSQAMQSGKEGRMADVLNTLGDGIAVTDESGTIATANHALRALLAVPSESELDQENVYALLRRQLGEDHAALHPAAADSPRRRFEIQCTDDVSDGVYRVSCAPLLTENGSSDAYVWTVRDITQQKLAEQMRTEFVETATHELRTPLANIRAYAETLQLADDVPVEQQKQFINIINAESTRLGRFVDELLNLSKMDAGSITISRHETDFERLLQESIEHTRPQIEARQLVFETQIPAKLPHLNVDKDKIAACLVNLLGNAAKYTPDGGSVRVTVEENAKELWIRVEDTGYGIAEDELPRVCARFFRSADDRVREESGSGLGLAYTQEIVRLHGGRLTVKSKLNEGSQFTLHLPL
ncbi:MAG: ATP-binding protein [Fuerstiella sp.]|jgi:two-component system phosphate regulon sensor histidine kinase PhoR|nr:ATP-binding protein [Fuerstiella sp.]